MPPPDFTTIPPDNPDRPFDEMIPCSVWICRSDGVAPYLPTPYFDLPRTTLEEWRDSVWARFLHPEDADAVIAEWERCVAAGTPWRCSYRFRRVDGGYRTIASRGIPVRDATGRVVLWAGVSLDVTGRDEPGGQLRELATLSEIARVIEEDAADPARVFRETGRLLPRGFSHPGEVSARVVSGTAAPGPGRIVAAIPAGHLVVEHREKPQGTEDPFLPQERGLVRAVAAMLGAAIAPAHTETAAPGQEYRLLFDQMPDAGLLFEILRDGSENPVGFRVVRINRKAAETLGRPHQEVAGEDLVTAVPSITPAVLDLLYRVARTGTPVHRDVSSPATGACYELKAYRPQYDLLAVIAEDVTDRRRADEILQKQQVALDNRVRELATLYAVSGVVERPGISVEEVLQEVAGLLPAGWLHPEDAAARITVDGREYRSPGFFETPLRQESPVVVHGRITGKVEVCYRHGLPGDGDAPLITDERRLIDAVAGRLGRIIERIRASEALGRSEEKYRLLFEQMLESYTLYEVVRDGEGNPVDYLIVELNEKAADVFGRSREELVGQRLFDIFPAIAKGARVLYGEVAETGVPVQRRLQEPRTGRWYDLQIYRPQPGRLAITGQDITEQKRAELALRESEERFRGIFEQAGTGIALIDPEGRIMGANPVFVRMFGYGEDELCGMQSRDLIYPPDREEAGALHQNTVREESTRREKRYVTKDGRIIWGRLTTSLLRDSGERGLVIAMVEDITDWRKLQNALAESEERFREIAQRSFDMIYTCYYDRGITYISPAVERILGYAPEEMIGERCSDYVLDRTRPEWQEARARIAGGEPVEGLVVELRRKDGTAAAVEMNESAITEGGRVVGVQIVGRDVSDRKHYEDMRLQAFYQIEQNIEQFAILADHIRLPLQVILGMADLTDDEATAEKIREQVERINVIVKQLDEGWVESRDIREFLRRNELV
ncbi:MULTISPECIES: PAS domain S-box protein [unclassified Methanoculleus]|uniref:PAS domain S-box protein n=1 Tax=unclassified Methanoculleus TaxID=2619537 RepID=UPI0025FB4F93|nr:MULTISPECIES: PAS domain S-box protein [unclassified Methanoculleus]